MIKIEIKAVQQRYLRYSLNEWFIGNHFDNDNRYYVCTPTNNVIDVSSRCVFLHMGLFTYIVRNRKQ